MKPSKNFYALVNKSIVMPRTTYILQTDGSYEYKTQISRTAAILTNHIGIKSTFVNTYLDHTNSYETEWQSLIDGVEYSQMKVLDFNIKALAIENDCLPIVTSIIQQNPPKKQLYLEYYKYFNNLYSVSHYMWFGIRWIPRELNKADDLFRI